VVSVSLHRATYCACARITFAPGASIPMHSHKDRPEVSVLMEGTLTNTVKGQSPPQLAAGTAVLNGPEVEHLPANACCCDLLRYRACAAAHP
jgi:quercetin dioxygenase-like cupin family protein